MGHAAGGDETVRHLLIDTLLSSLREDFAAYAPSAPEVERLIDRPSQQSEYLRIMAHGWQRQGAVKKAFDAYLELAKLSSDLQTSGGATERELERIDRNWHARADRWLQARFGELLRTAGEADRVAMEQTIQKSFERATASGEVSVRLTADVPTVAGAPTPSVTVSQLIDQAMPFEPARHRQGQHHVADAVGAADDDVEAVSVAGRVCGDALCGVGVDGAWCSARALAAAVIDQRPDALVAPLSLALFCLLLFFFPFDAMVKSP